MSAELDFSKGRAAIFSVGETPWHKEGVILAQAPTIAEALTLGGLDFEVQKMPTFVGQSRGPTGGFIPALQSKLAFVTVRTDTEAELGSVGPDYTVLQNANAFRILQPLLDAGVVALETGGALRGGRDVWLLVRFNIAKFGPIVKEVFTDEVVPFGLLRNNHAGTRAAALQLTPIRVVCANTLGMADSNADLGIDKSVTVRHTGDIEARLVDAAQLLLGGIIERYEVVAKQYKLLKSYFLDEALFRELVLNVAAPDPRKVKGFNPDAPTAAMVVDRAERKIAAIHKAWAHGKGHVGDRSAWEAYNGVVEVIDHNTGLYPTRGGAYRTASLMDGKLGELKRTILKNLVQAAS